MPLGDPVRVLSEQRPPLIGNQIAPAARPLGGLGPGEVRQRPVPTVDPLLLTGRDEDLTLLGSNAEQIGGCLHVLPGPMNLTLRETRKEGAIYWSHVGMAPITAALGRRGPAGKRTARCRW